MTQSQIPPVDVEAVVELTRALIRIPSVAGRQGGERAAAELVAETMSAFGWHPQLTEVSPGRTNVVTTLEGGGGPGPTLALEGHLDVVTEGDRSAWTVDPFGAEVREGRLYGRGAADMKAGVAAMLHGARALQRSGPFPGRLRLLALCDEEGMMLGAKRAVADGHLDGVSGVIICEPEGGEICPSSKGALRLRFDLAGRMAHGAMPELGRSPIPVAGLLVQELANVQAALQRDPGPHPTLGLTYLTPTVLVAGSLDQMNVTPARATLAVDVRTIPGVDHARLLDDLRLRCDRLGRTREVTIELTVIDDRPPVEIGAEEPLVRALEMAHSELWGHSATLGGVPGTTDGTIITRDTGIPTVVYGPGGKWIAHQADEFVEVEEIPRYADTYARAAQIFLWGPTP
ncbi:MAG: M20 family metallopeptidase [Candidatus Dormibacteria bacterium]